MAQILGLEFQDGRLLVQSENTVFDQFGLAYKSNITEDKYVLLIDKNNNFYPHNKSGLGTTNDFQIHKLHVTFRFLQSNTIDTLDIKIGVITRITNTNADIRYLINIPIKNGDNAYSQDYPTPIKFQAIQDTYIISGMTLSIPFSTITNTNEYNVSAVNLLTNLENMTTTNHAPNVGDIIAHFVKPGSDVLVSLLLFYSVQ